MQKVTQIYWKYKYKDSRNTNHQAIEKINNAIKALCNEGSRTLEREDIGAQDIRAQTHIMSSI